MRIERMAPTWGLWRGVNVSVGVLNVFDTRPQCSLAGQEYDRSLSGDPRQRYGYINIEKRFGR